MPSRGQAWAEYIIVLAVVVIMAGVAMYLAGGFAGGSGQIEERESAAYWLSADVGIIRYYLNSSMAQLVIKNNRNFKIRVDSITWNDHGELVAGGGSSVILEPGQNAQVNVTGLSCSSSTYRMQLLVRYTDATYGTTYSFYGEKPLVGQCMGSSPISTPECSSDPECGANSTTCDSYCNGNQNCTYPSDPATCQRTCSGGKCIDCLPSCGSATCTSCGTMSISCPAAYCNGNQNCTYPPSASCDAPCSGGACTNCTPNCSATCADCPTGQICQDGQCITVPTCGTDCVFGGNGICNVSCSGDCSNFRLACDDISQNVKVCTNSTGGTANPPLNNYVNCCNGAIINCGINTTSCPSPYCNGNQNCTYPPNASCNIPCSGGNCTDCFPSCIAACTTCPSGRVCQNGQCLACLSNCTWGDSTCHSQCSGLGGCTTFRAACDGQPLNARRCSNSTGGILGSPLRYYINGCCGGQIRYCGGSRVCTQTTPTTITCV